MNFILHCPRFALSLDKIGCTRKYQLEQAKLLISLVCTIFAKKIKVYGNIIAIELAWFSDWYINFFNYRCVSSHSDQGRILFWHSLLVVVCGGWRGIAYRCSAC